MPATLLPRDSRSDLSALRPAGLGMLVVIDSGVEDIETLVSGVLPGARVAILDSERDGVAQISAADRKSVV